MEFLIYPLFGEISILEIPVRGNFFHFLHFCIHCSALGAFGAELFKTGPSQATGVWIIVPVGIGEVLMTTFFSKAKSLPKINQTEEKENWLPPPHNL